MDRHGLPLAVTTHAANHHEVTLVQLTFDSYMVEAKPENLIGSKAYDSDPLDAAMRDPGHGDDFSAPFQQKAQDTGRLPTASVRASLDRRALLCVDSVTVSALSSLGILRDQSPRHGAASSPMHPS